MCDPFARETKNGSPPTFRNARTGELTPPGMKRLASANNEELDMVETSPSDKPSVKLGRTARVLSRNKESSVLEQSFSLNKCRDFSETSPILEVAHYERAV